MITAEAFLAIEEALTQRLLKAYGRITKEVFSKVDAALASGDTDKALQELNTLNLSKMLDKEKAMVEYFTNMAMLFGASRVTQQPGTSVVGMGFEKLATKQMVDAFMQLVTQKADAYLKEVGAKFIQPPVQKEDRASVLRPFSSFMNESGKAFFNMAASLHTSRVSAYGFTSEAEALGLDEYQITEQLDTRTCPVCRRMHGKVFQVSDARSLLDVVTRVSNVDDLKTLQPWPKRDKETLAKIDSMSAADFVNASWHIPPYHPGCRGLLTRVGKAPSLAAVAAGTYKEKYESSVEDFKALGIEATEAMVKKWNSLSTLSPAEVVARLTGVPADEFLVGLIESDDPKKYAGLSSMTSGKAVTIQIAKEGFGSKQKFDQTVKLSDGKVLLESLDIRDVDQGAGVAKGFMKELYTIAKDLGSKSLALYASEVGSYAWAKYGFKPDLEQWIALKKDIGLRYNQKKMAYAMGDMERQLYTSIMASSDPAAIFTLSDVSFGKGLLLGLGWYGELDLTDPESVTRFLSYIGELK